MDKILYGYATLSREASNAKFSRLTRTFHSLLQSNHLCRKVNKTDEHYQQAYRNTSTNLSVAGWLSDKRGVRGRSAQNPDEFEPMNNS
jgi:hypothetical protein